MSIFWIDILYRKFSNWDKSMTFHFDLYMADIEVLDSIVYLWTTCYLLFCPATDIFK
jgi:hypothetical protein